MSSIVAELSGARHAKAVSAPMNNQSRAGGAHRLNLPASSISSLWQWPRTCGPARSSAPRKTNDPQSPLGHALVDDEAQRYRPQWVGGERGRVRPRLRASAGVPRLEESASVQHVLCEETTDQRFSKRLLRKTTEFSTTIQSIQCNIQCAPTMVRLAAFGVVTQVGLQARTGARTVVSGRMLGKAYHGVCKALPALTTLMTLYLHHKLAHTHHPSLRGLALPS